MARPKTRRSPLNKMRMTRRVGRKGGIVDVRSPKDVKMFEKLIVNGSLTMVFAKLQGCGPCEAFHKNVWTPLTKLKNRSMNLATVDSEVFNKTSLSNVPRKFYPTIMLVGKDKKAATWKDETGQPTNAMPRKASLEEDRAALTALVQSPTGNLPETLSTPIPAGFSVDTEPSVGDSMEYPTTQPSLGNNSARTVNNLPLRNTPVLRNSPGRQSMNLPASPFDNEHEPDVPSEVAEENQGNQGNQGTQENQVNQGNQETQENQVNQENTTSNVSPIKFNKNKNAVATKPASTVPNVASDLLATQMGTTTGTAGVLTQERKVGGGLLAAIRRKNLELNTILGMRSGHKAKTRRFRSK